MLNPEIDHVKTLETVFDPHYVVTGGVTVAVGTCPRTGVVYYSRALNPRQGYWHRAKGEFSDQLRLAKRTMSIVQSTWRR